MLHGLNLLPLSLLGLALVGLDRCTAQVCPSLDYGLATKRIGTEPWCATSGDVNGDGAADLFIGRSPLFTTGGLSLLVNSGMGTFPTAIELAGVSSPRSLALADLDGDGDLDLVASDQGVLDANGFHDDGMIVFLNDGQGHFSAFPLVPFDATDDEPEGLSVGDLDHDFDLDVVVAIRYHQTGPLTSDSRVLVFLNDGQGHLTAAGSFPAGSKPGTVVLRDFDGDGALDYATVNTGASSVSVVRGLGDGTFEATAATYVVGTYASGLTSGDFDGDGDVDLAVGWKYGLRVLFNQGNGTFTSGPVQLFGYYNKAMLSGDFNQDGKMDLVASFASPGDVKVLTGNGDGTFSVYRSYNAGLQVYALTVGDWNRDAILDVASADNDGADAKIWSSECGTWVYCTAKTNSLGCIPAIGYSGTPSASAGRGFLVSAANVRNKQTSMLIYGTHGRAALPFFGGTLCIAGSLHRTPAQSSGGSPTGADCSGQVAFDFNVWIAGGSDPSLVPGTHVDVQFYSRDAGFPPPDNIGLTDALEFTIGS